MEENLQFEPRLAAPGQTSGRAIWLAALVAFLLGAVLVGWFGWRGGLDRLPWRDASDRPVVASPGSGEESKAAAELKALASVETRLALLEERQSRLNLQATAASGNATRAEALLVALAARRRIERGAQLDYVEEPLMLRFGNAQPQAVRTLVAFTRDPVTLDRLEARLDLLAPRLADAPAQDLGWERLRREIGNLFVIRREPQASVTPEDRIAQAKLMLTAGRVEGAIEEVNRLHGSEAATADWIADARRYGAAQQALEFLEATALLDTRGPNDEEGNKIAQPSPLAPNVAP